MGKKHDSQYANFGWLHLANPYSINLFMIVRNMACFSDIALL